jgi:hypothetical protein
LKVRNQLALSTVLAIALSGASVFIEHNGPELAQYGNLCGPASNDPCREPVLKGGFPVAFLFDQPGVSVEHQLAFFEDNLRIDAFALNTALYFVALVMLAYALSVSRKRKSR